MEVVIQLISVVLAMLQGVTVVACYLIVLHLVTIANEAVQRQNAPPDGKSGRKLAATNLPEKMIQIRQYRPRDWEIFWDTVDQESKHLIDVVLRRPRRLDRRCLLRLRQRTHVWTGHPAFNGADFYKALWAWHRWQMPTSLEAQAAQEFPHDSPEQRAFNYFVSEWFCRHYDADQAVDYAYRFSAIVRFAVQYRGKLCATPERIIRVDRRNRSARHVWFKAEFLKFILGGFQDPLFRGHAATHPLTDSRGDFMYAETLTAFRAWVRREQTMPHARNGKRPSVKTRSRGKVKSPSVHN